MGVWRLDRRRLNEQNKYHLCIQENDRVGKCYNSMFALLSGMHLGRMNRQWEKGIIGKSYDDFGGM